MKHFELFYIKSTSFPKPFLKDKLAKRHGAGAKTTPSQRCYGPIQFDILLGPQAPPAVEKAMSTVLLHILTPPHCNSQSHRAEGRVLPPPLIKVTWWM